MAKIKLEYDHAVEYTRTLNNIVGATDDTTGLRTVPTGNDANTKYCDSENGA